MATSRRPGLQIDSFTIQAIRDESGYMELIGQQETARRERDARMAKASADQEAAVREAEAEQIKINAARDVSLRRAETETQTAAAQARAAQSGPLAEAEATQEVVRKQTELAELEAARKQKELLTSTVRPAEAEAEAQIRRAEGEKGARIAQAQAEAERVKLAGTAEAAVTVTKGEAQAKVISINAEAEAHRTEVEGNAEAGITFTKGEAEAKALALRAEAYRQFNEAAIIQTVLSMLPEIVRAAAEPLSNIQTMTVLSNDGASDVVRNVTRTVSEANATVKGLTGIDIPALINDAVGGSSAGRFLARAAAAAEEGKAPIAPAPAGRAQAGPRSPGRAPASRDRLPPKPPRAARRRARAPRRRPGPAQARPRWNRPGVRHQPPLPGLPRPPAPATGPKVETPAAVDAAMAGADRAIRAATTSTPAGLRPGPTLPSGPLDRPSRDVPPARTSRAAPRSTRRP